MDLGTIIFFNNETGFGVIQNDEWGKYYFITVRFGPGQKTYSRDSGYALMLAMESAIPWR
jgi:hypothetical protein